MKRYVVAAWDTYESLPGLGNIQASFHKHENAQQLVDLILAGRVFNRAEVYDTQTYDPIYTCDATVDALLSEMGVANDKDA